MLTVANRNRLVGLLAVAGVLLVANRAPAQVPAGSPTQDKQEKYEPQKYGQDPAPAAADKPAAAPDGKEKDTTEKKEKPECPRPRLDASLSAEALLLTAMEKNPDILVAKAKLREAEAELNRTRLQVARKILTLRESVPHQRERAADARKLVKTAVITRVQLGAILSELSALEAELQYTLGQPLDLPPEK